MWVLKYLVFYNNVVSKSNVNEISHEIDLRTFDNYSMMMNDDYVDLVDVDLGLEVLAFLIALFFPE